VEYPFSGETTKAEFGYKTTLVEGRTELLLQFLYKAAEHGYTVLINEFNMAWPEVPTAFMNLVDKGETIRLPDGRVIKKHPDFALIATENYPDTRFASSPEYAGAKPQNQAVENRFGVNMEVPYPPEKEETAILQLLNPDISEKLTSNLVTFVGDMRAAIDRPTISEPTKQILKRFAVSTDELMQLVLRNHFDQELVAELTKMFKSLTRQQQEQIAPHMARLMPLLRSE
jgi:MoxR-like ATPase